MNLYPAIDLYDGACVRLYKGDYGKRTEYFRDPMEPFSGFLEAGIQHVHIVDLNAAKGEDSSRNRAAIEAMAAALPSGVQVGGGVRSRDDISRWLDLGVWRTILGTVAAREPEKVLAWATRYPGQVVAGLDARDGMVFVNGWQEEGAPLAELAQVYAGSDVGAILYTAIARDGTMQGPDTDGAVALAVQTGLPVIVSGGVSCVEDLWYARSHAQASALDGVIIGKAFYEGAISLKEIRTLLQAG